MPSPYYSTKAKPAAAVPSETFATTIGPGQAHATIESANTAFQASGLPEAKFYIFGAVTVGSATVTIPQSVDMIGVDDSPTIDLNQDIESGSGADTEDSLYRFMGLRIQVTGASEISQLAADQRYEFLDCDLEMTATGIGSLWALRISAAGQVVCRNCLFDDSLATPTDGYFQNATGNLLSLYLHACSESGLAGSYLLKNAGGQTDVYFLDGTRIRRLVLVESANSSGELFQDGSSTFNLSKASLTNTVLRRLGSATFYGSYTGDGSIFRTIAQGWQFDTRYVRIWTRQTVPGGAVIIFETTEQIVTDGTIRVDTFVIESDRIVSLGFGQFLISDDGSDSDPNKTGQDYNFMVSG